MFIKKVKTLHFLFMPATISLQMYELSYFRFRFYERLTRFLNRMVNGFCIKFHQFAVVILWFLEFHLYLEYPTGEVNEAAGGESTSAVYSSLFLFRENVRYFGFFRFHHVLLAKKVDGPSQTCWRFN